MSSPQSSSPQTPAIVTQLSQAMDSLVTLIEQETEHVRNGRMVEASGLEARKAELARVYATSSRHISLHRDLLSQTRPAEYEILKKQHESFMQKLQLNMTVLATAHAVAEGIVRGVSGEMTRKAQPSTYGAAGRASVPTARAIQPIAVSRHI